MKLTLVTCVLVAIISQTDCAEGNCRIHKSVEILFTFTNRTQFAGFHAAPRRRIRRPSTLSNITETAAVAAAKKPEVRVRSSTSTRSTFVPVKKVAQDRSDQQPAPSTNRFRVRSKHRGVIGAASAAVATTGTAAVLNQSSKSKDKDGYKVCPVPVQHPRSDSNFFD